jgi:hypothetical protein
MTTWEQRGTGDLPCRHTWPDRRAPRGPGSVVRAAQRFRIGDTVSGLRRIRLCLQSRPHRRSRRLYPEAPGVHTHVLAARAGPLGRRAFAKFQSHWVPRCWAVLGSQLGRKPGASRALPWRRARRRWAAGVCRACAHEGMAQSHISVRLAGSGLSESPATKDCAQIAQGFGDSRSAKTDL